MQQWFLSDFFQSLEMTTFSVVTNKVLFEVVRRHYHGARVDCEEFRGAIRETMELLLIKDGYVFGLNAKTWILERAKYFSKEFGRLWREVCIYMVFYWDLVFICI